MVEETVVEENLWNKIGEAWGRLTGEAEPVIAPEDAVEQHIGELTIPPILPGAKGLEPGQMKALGDGVGGLAAIGGLMGKEVPAFAAEGLGYSPGQIDLIDDLARRYDGLNAETLQSLLVGLAVDDTLRDSVMDSLMADDQQLAHYAIQAFEANDGLQDQFEDLVRNNPEAVREMLPALEENPEQFTELVTAASRTPEEAKAANDAAAKAAAEASQNTMMSVLGDVFTGKTSFTELLGPNMGGMLDSFLGPLMAMFKDMFSSVKGFIGNNLPEDSQVYDLMEQGGIPRDAITNVVGAPDPNAAPTRDPSPDLTQEQKLAEPNYLGLR